jgi:hypothetical protein
MCWYIFYTPRGWAAICTNDSNLRINIVKASVLPTPSPLTTLFYINRQQTGLDIRFVSLVDNFFSINTKIRQSNSGNGVALWEWRHNLPQRYGLILRMVMCVVSRPAGRSSPLGRFVFLGFALDFNLSCI